MRTSIIKIIVAAVLVGILSYFTSGVLLSESRMESSRRLPRVVSHNLERMESDIQQASAIIELADNYLLMLDNEGEYQEYSFESGILWKNGSSYIHRVQSFHFEYRDCYGYMLSRPANQRKSLKTVCYVISLENFRRPLRSGGRVQISPKAERNASDRTRMVAYNN